MKIPEKKDLTIKNILFYICVLLLGLLALKVVMRLLPPAIFLFLILAPPIFVLADSQERRLSRPVLWATFTLFTNVFGLVVYLLIRPDQQVIQHCKNCGGSVEEKFANCPWCGDKIDRPLTKCPGCNDEIQDEWKFCPGCNYNLKSTAEPAEKSA